MQTHRGLVTEIREAGGAQGSQRQVIGYIDCPGAAVPKPGQYVLDVSGGDPVQDWHSEPVLATVLFPTLVFGSDLNHQGNTGFWAASPDPFVYSPGKALLLTGPMGRGFRISPRTHRLGIAALGNQLARVLPIIDQVLNSQNEVVLFCDLPLPERLPPVVEAHPVAELHELLSWVDELVIDLPGDRVDKLGETLGLSPRSPSPCPGQVLVESPMPCAGMAVCGVCAVRTRRGSSLVCEQGPVYDLALLLR